MHIFNRRALLPIPLFAVIFAAATRLGAASPETERQFLSGHDPQDAVPWNFTVTGGRRAGERTTIPVPSHWELHGFGTYNYGQELNKSDEHGLYSLRFAVPAAWKGRRIRLVFEGVMTDTAVKINGRSAGPTHQGGFYRFRYDITPLVKTGAGADGENLLEVDVAKVSANADTERAERGGDYWVFGGIYRPVYLEAVPAQSIAHAALDARADGTLTADVTLGSVREADRVEAQILTPDGQPVGALFFSAIPAGGTGQVRLATRFDAPRLWTAETPHLYTLRLTLRQGTEALHTVTERFGFRTFEVRAGQGLYLNGQRILLKGVDRHSFRPDTGRALTREDCYADARLIKAMNMNSVRMSHYPPDVDFLEACDELGLYVLDELSGWQHAHDTAVGRLLVREMVERDVNHPSILLWDNGNEGGWNRELDGEFALYDPQKRRVLHPWELHDDIDTKHYPPFDDLAKRLRGPHLVMPTEFLHGLYDGGMGSGLEDYWHAIATSPFGAGGFLWVLADEGVVRTDQDGRVDVFSTFAPDGIVGPRHEKEASYHTVRDLWSPVQISPPVLDGDFSGTLRVRNAYDFTSIAQCRFAWRLVRFADETGRIIPPPPSGTQRVKADSPYQTTLASGLATAPAVGPHADGKIALALPPGWRDADALAFTALDPASHELWSWTWPTPALARRLAAPTAPPFVAAPKLETSASEIRLSAGSVTASFDPATGLLRALRRGEKSSALVNGPRLAFARPATVAKTAWMPFASEDAATPTRRLATPHLANTVELEFDFTRPTVWAGLKLEISPDGQTWKTLFDSSRRPNDGKLYDFPPQLVAAVRVSNLRRADGGAAVLKSMRIGYAAGRFPAEPATRATVTTGSERDPQSGGTVAWLESRGAAGLDRFRWSLRGDGSLRLDYAYTLNGEFAFHGITFDHPEEKMNSLRWLGEGPHRVWQNRLRGTWLGVHEIARSDPQPGESWAYPEFQGCFAGLRWARLDTTAGPLTVASASPEIYLRVGTPRITHPHTMVDFPSGDLSFLHAIPPMGSKFKPAEFAGPASRWAKAAGTYSGTLTFRFGDDGGAVKP